MLECSQSGRLPMVSRPGHTGTSVSLRWALEKYRYLVVPEWAEELVKMVSHPLPPESGVFRGLMPLGS